MQNTTTTKHMEKNNITAVEWLAEQLSSVGIHIGYGMYEQAKEMEKQQSKITEDTSDGYHTFKELYEFRKVYNACLFNEWAKRNLYGVHKSIRHHDGELCFGGGWFIVVAMLPTGQISNHYRTEDWELFKIPAKSSAIVEFDGHTSSDVIERLKNL